MLNEKQLKYIANFSAEWIYQHLISTTRITHVDARRAAVNAANKAAQSLERDLEEVA